MNDEKIIDLFFERDEQAIRESMNTYGGYCRTVAAGILADPSDIEEAVADTWLAAWDAIPPHRPPAIAAAISVNGMCIIIGKSNP